MPLFPNVQSSKIHDQHKWLAQVWSCANLCQPVLTCTNLCFCWHRFCFKFFAIECRMEAAPSVPFHERAPDLMAEEDLRSSQLEAEESVNRLQAAHWQLPRDLKESAPAEKADRADLAFGVPTGRADRAYGVSPGQAERANLASGIPPERAGVPFSTSERAQKGETSYGLQDASAYGGFSVIWYSETSCLDMQMDLHTCCMEVGLSGIL